MANTIMGWFTELLSKYEFSYKELVLWLPTFFTFTFYGLMHSKNAIAARFPHM